MGAGTLKVQGFLKVVLPLKCSEGQQGALLISWPSPVTLPVKGEVVSRMMGFQEKHEMRRDRGLCGCPGCEQCGCGVCSLELGGPIHMIWLNPFQSPRLSQPQSPIAYSFRSALLSMIQFFAQQVLRCNLTYGALSLLHAFRAVHGSLGESSRLLESPGTAQGLAGKCWATKKLEKS